MDGITAVLVEFTSDKPRVIDSLEHPYSPATLALLQEIVTPSWRGHLSEISELDTRVGREFGSTASQLLARNGSVAVQAIGSHGQTIYHNPDSPTPSSWQIGDPNIIAEMCDLPVIGDWRRRDIAAGGQGAPLVPAFHRRFFSSDHPVALLNLGGIANITTLPASPVEPTLGFDTGPANTLLDQWIKKHCGNHFDAEGQWASQGTLIPELLGTMLEDKFFSLPPPKSTGREYFNLDWLEKMLSKFATLEPRDVQRTLTELTAVTIYKALTSVADDTQELYVCGGGVKNHFLMERISNLFEDTSVKSTSAAGIDPLLMEAMAFAWLASRTMAQLPGNLPQATGARGDRILGGIYWSSP